MDVLCGISWCSCLVSAIMRIGRGSFGRGETSESDYWEKIRKYFLKGQCLVQVLGMSWSQLGNGELKGVFFFFFFLRGTAEQNVRESEWCRQGNTPSSSRSLEEQGTRANHLKQPFPRGGVPRPSQVPETLVRVCWCGEGCGGEGGGPTSSKQCRFLFGFLTLIISRVC